MRFLPVFILLFANISVQAQKTFGLKFGMNESWITYEENATEKLMKPYKKIKSGIVFGAVAEIRLNPVMRVSANILYSQKGLKYKQPGYTEGKIKMNYLEIPVAGKYLVLSPKKNPLGIFFGGYGAFWLNGKYISTDFKTGESLNTKIDFNSSEHQYSRTDAGIVFGFDKEFNSKNSSWNFECRYAHGMLSSARYRTDAMLHRVFSVSLTYLFL